MTAGWHWAHRRNEGLQGQDLPTWYTACRGHATSKETICNKYGLNADAYDVYQDPNGPWAGIWQDHPDHLTNLNAAIDIKATFQESIDQSVPKGFLHVNQ